MNSYDIRNFRRFLHSNAEISGQEERTSLIVREFIEKTSPDQIIAELGGYGIAAIYEGQDQGPAVLIRADMDALPIAESIELDYGSTTQGVSHKCGHDGHMAIVAGLALELQQKRLKRGKVILLFQPSEETGEGAKQVIAAPEFNKIKPDYAFALHNLPGYPLGQVVVREGSFTSASKGVIVKFEGASAHASEPHMGKNPAMATAQLIQGFTALAQLETALHDAAKVTVIHARIGDVAFGTSPGESVVMATLRSHKPEIMERLEKRSVELAAGIAMTYDLKHNIKWVEQFPATINDVQAVKWIEEVATKVGLEIYRQSVPFAWSEDFGHFTATAKGALFGLGAGETTPVLHQQNYDFPDNLLDIGIKIFLSLVQKILD